MLGKIVGAVQNAVLSWARSIADTLKRFVSTLGFRHLWPTPVIDLSGSVI